MKIRLSYVVCAVIYGVGIAALLPAQVVVLNDDFAYLRSLIETLQHGRPWTNDWLEPWAAGFSGVSALAFRATGSFYAATYGVLAVCAAWGFGAACLLAESRGLGRWRSIVVTAAGLTLPTLFWKQLQFTGLALYLPCLLTALVAVERRRWGVFLFVWVLAFSTRQSAIVWGVLPLIAFLRAKPGPGSNQERFALAAVLLAGAGLFGLLAVTMNKTAAQAAITDRVWQDWNLVQAARAAGLAGGAFLLFRGLAIGAAGHFDAAPSPGRPRWRIAAAVVLSVCWLALDPRQLVGCEFETYDGLPGLVYFKIAGVLAIAALGAGEWRVNGAALAAGAAATVLLTLRAVTWDYYLLDVAVFGAWSIVGQPAPTRKPGAWSRGWATVAVAVFGLFHAWGIIQAKSVLDRTRVMIDLGAQAVESGRLPPADASILPFGLMAWYFFPYYVAHEGKGSANLADFGCYLAHDTTLVAWRFSRSLRRLPNHDGGIPDEPSGPPIIRGRYRYFWIYDVDVLLYRNAPERIIPARFPYPRDYRLPVFPRDDTGWRNLIESSR